MRFEDFARLHGLILRDLVPNRWMSTPTEDHPHKRNGRYKFLGDVGWVHNWATMDSPAMWRSDKPLPRPVFKKLLVDSDKDRQELAEKAAAKAAWIMHQTRSDTHPYLVKKGFPDEVGNVWDNEGAQTLVIPMRCDNRLVGVQLIDEQGQKKFLYGQSTKGAAFMIDARGMPIFCEGYATALSIRVAMKAIKIRYSIYVCFSASNLQAVAQKIPGGIVVADNDPNGTGEKAAREAGKPYWISDTVGEDFNDYHIRVGLFKASQSLKRSLVFQ